ncbi:MAG: DUF2156 domain-containing protein [Elusimicrobia bacterium]|nr:DUF2156 domain-containing protein [Elusimicrobiota bacterium]
MMEFRGLEQADFARLKAFFEESEHPHSEYSLASTIVWDRCIMTMGCAVDGEDVFLSETNPADPKERFLLLPIPGGKRFAPAVLKQKALEAGFTEYRFVHDAYVSHHGMEEVEKHFKVSEQPGYTDYVYRAKDLASLDGRDLAKKRNNIRQFEKECAAHGWKVETVRLSSANAAACVECLEQWRNEQEDANWTGILACEGGAIRRALADFDGLEFRGLMVLVNGMPRGFGVAARLNRDTGVLLFEKASDRHKGLYQYLDRECCRLLFDNWQWVNKEGDMGDPGLARAKESYAPFKRVKAFSLELR